MHMNTIKTILIGLVLQTTAAAEQSVGLSQSSPAEASRGNAASSARLIQIEGEQPQQAGTQSAGDVATLRLAIEDLVATFGDRYPKGTEYLTRLKQLEESADNAALELLRQEALLANPLLDFDSLLLVRRPANAPSLGLPANWQGNTSLSGKGFDDELMVLQPVSPDGALTSLHKPDKQFVGDVDLHYNADRVLLSSRNEAGRWRIYEMTLSDHSVKPIKQIEEPDVDNYDAAYLPDGRIVFSSTATYVGVPCVFGSSHVANLYRVDPASGQIDRLTFDQEHNWNPVVMPSGQVLYQRWEYADTPHSNSRLLFAMNPDGTAQREFYGASSYFPNSIFYARPVPGSPGMVAGIATGHHGTRRSGRLLMLHSAQGRREAQGVVREIPGRDKRVTPIVRDRLVDGVWPQFLHPMPLSEKYVLVSVRLSAKQPWAIYLVDAFDNMVKIKDAPGSALLEPIPLRRTARPLSIPDRIDRSKTTGTVYVADVYRGDGLRGIPRGTVKKLRLVSYYYGSRGMGGLLGSIGMDGPWDIRHVIGTVPVEADGSAYFEAPADTPITIQPLDDEGKALQQMRSWLVTRPGERVSCTGCHDKQNAATPNDATHALRREPSPVKPWHGPTRGFSFAREVQPVLDRHCVACHGGKASPDLRGDKIIADWASQIRGHVNESYGGKFSVSYAALHRYVRRPGIESDLHVLTPMDFHADTTELVQILRKGHHGVKVDDESWDRLITWIDLNAPYHGTWSEIVGKERVEPIVARRTELERQYGGSMLNYEHIPPPADLGQPIPEREVAASKVSLTTMSKEVTPTESSNDKLQQMTIELGDDVVMKLMKVPAGRFDMGSDDGHKDEQPRRSVAVDQPYWIGQFEVTNAQYARFDPSHDSRLESRHGYQFGRLGYALNEPNQPVVRVSYEHAMEFCNWLSKKTGHHVTLPTEAQWEYACRAGTDGAFSFRGEDFSKHANLGDRSLKDYAACTSEGHYSTVKVLENPNVYDDWVPKDDRFDDGEFLAASVGHYRANPWGLHDMHGNVWEWTRSAYQPYPYVDGDGRNDVSRDTRRVVRGGSWYDRPHRATSSYRLSYRPWQPVYNVGLRIVIEEPVAP